MGSKGKRRFRAPRMPAMQQLEQLQSQIAQTQASLEEEMVTVTVGGGAVTIEMTGTQDLRSVSISPEAVDPDDVEMLEDLIVAAFKGAQEEARRLAAEKLGPLSGGLDISGLL